jgi:glycosyltransferase involved in cell wall biosynthesis
MERRTIMQKITIGIPCFNEETNVPRTYQKIKEVIKRIKSYQFNFLFVDNCSTDKTREEIKKLIKKDKKVRAIFLSRNFGQEASGAAIIENANTDALVIIDCDLQDPPELILRFIEKWKEGYEVVWGKYTKIQDPFPISFFRKAFYYVFKKMSNIDVPVQTTGFGLYDKKVLEAIKLLPERYRFNRGLLSWVGFRHAFISYKRRKRIYGRSSYNFWAYLKYSQRGIFGFSYLPLDLMSYLGFILTLISFIFIIVYLLINLFYGNPLKASITLMSAVVFFGGVNLLALSIIGKYIQVIVEETKARPIYIIKEKLNFKK